MDGWKGAKNRSVKWSILTLTSLSSPVQVQSLLGHLTLASSILRWHATSEKICKIIRGQKNHIIEEKWNGTLHWSSGVEQWKVVQQIRRETHISVDAASVSFLPAGHAKFYQLQLGTTVNIGWPENWISSLQFIFLFVSLFRDSREKLSKVIKFKEEIKIARPSC